MGKNVEIKAKLRNPGRQRKLASALADSPPWVLQQRDTFFEAPLGRLKLRQLTPDRGELIHYERPDVRGPKSSRYTIVQTGEPERLRSLLAAALGIRGEVRKRRTVYLAGQTRIHLDEVEQLGEYLELEVVLETAQQAEDGEVIAKELMRALEVDPDDLVQGAYLDLLLQRER